MENQQLDAIYKRHMTAVDRTSGGGAWIDRSAVGIVLSLAIDEAASTAVLRCENESEVAISQLRGQLKEVSNLLQASEAQREQWQGEAGAAGEKINELRATLAFERVRQNELRTWLIGNDLPLPSAVDVIQAAIDALTAQQDEIAALGAANATLHERLAQAAPAVLLPTLGSTKELAAVLAIVDHGGANGNGVAPAPSVKHRRRQAAAPDNSGRLTKEETKALAFRLVRELNRALLRPPKMKEFDDARPEEDIATAEAVIKRFGYISWMAFVDAALNAKDAA